MVPQEGFEPPTPSLRKLGWVPSGAAKRHIAVDRILILQRLSHIEPCGSQKEPEFWCVPSVSPELERWPREGQQCGEIRLPDMVFTEQRIAALPLPANGEMNYHDPSVPGLGVRCRPGSKSYIVRYRIGGRASPSVRLTLGAAGSGGIPLGDAKKIAARIAADVAHGRDPRLSSALRSKRPRSPSAG